MSVFYVCIIMALQLEKLEAKLCEEKPSTPVASGRGKPNLRNQRARVACFNLEEEGYFCREVSLHHHEAAWRMNGGWQEDH